MWAVRKSLSKGLTSTQTLTTFAWNAALENDHALSELSWTIQIQLVSQSEFDLCNLVYFDFTNSNLRERITNLIHALDGVILKQLIIRCLRIVMYETAGSAKMFIVKFNVNDRSKFKIMLDLIKISQRNSD